MIFIERLEEQVFPAEQLKTLCIECGSVVPEYKDIEKIACKYGIVVTSLQGAFSDGKKTIIKYDVRIPKYIDFSKVDLRFRQEFSILSIALED